MAQINRIQISVCAPPSLTLQIDEEQLHLLCSNLVLNALQHSHTEGVVRVVVESSGNWAELRVIDAGTGIEPELLPHIFERFYRGDPSRSRRTGGTGLGLAICHAIVLKFQGTIHVDSELGKGTTVSVRLPLQPDHIAETVGSP